MKKAFAFGVNRYSESFYGGGIDLNECVNDAYRIGKRLADYGWAVTGYTDKEATISRWYQITTKILQEAKDGDLYCFYFSGHGTYQDIRQRNGKHKRQTAICLHDYILFDGDILKFLKALPKGVRVLWITDSCFSESNYRSAKKAGQKLKFAKTNRLIDVDNVPPTSSATGVKCQVIALNSCQSNEYSSEVEGIGGIFTDAILQADMDRKVTTYGHLLKKITAIIPKEYQQTASFTSIQNRAFKSQKIFE